MAPLAFGDLETVLKLSPGESYLSASVIDSTNGFAYFATGNS
jgi:hypothetical protein